MSRAVVAMRVLSLPAWRLRCRLPPHLYPPGPVVKQVSEQLVFTNFGVMHPIDTPLIGSPPTW